MKKLFLLALALGCIRAEEAKLYLQLGHSQGVFSVAFSADGNFVLTGGDKTARLWDTASGAELRHFEGHSNTVWSAAFSPDGRFVVTGSADKTARLWDTASGAELRRFRGHDGFVASVAFSPDGHFVLTGGEDTARLWDTATGADLRSFKGHDGFVASVAFSPDGRFVLTGSNDTTARLWDAVTGAELRRFVGHYAAVTSVAFSPDGRFVMTGGDDKTAVLWDTASGAKLRRFGNHDAVVGSAAFYRASVDFSSDGRFVLTGSDDNARLWDAASGAELRRFVGHSSLVTSVAFSSDGRFVLTGSLDNTARLWDTATGAELRRFEGHSDSVNSVAFSPNGRFVLIGNDDKIAGLWDTATGAELRRFEGHSDSVRSVAFSPDGRFVLTGSDDQTARLWDAANGAELHRFKGHSDPVRSVAFSPDGRFVLTGSEDDSARLWDAATGAEIRRFVGHSAAVTSVAFSPDGRFVLIGSGDSLKVEILNPEIGFRHKSARLWDAATGAALHRFEGHDGSVASVAFSPDGRFVLTGSNDKTARLWDAATGAQLRRFDGHSDRHVYAVAFSPDGRFVVTGSYDTTARLWDSATGAELRRFEGHSDEVRSVTYSPDRRFLMTGSRDGTTRLWDPSSGKWLASLVSFREGGWAVVDPEGRYDASDPDNSPGLHFVAGLDVIELGQLKQRFYTPGLLARIWRGEPLPSVTGLHNVKLVPGLEVKPPGVGSTEATVRLTSRGGGIGRVIVKVNGRELPAATRGASIDPDASSAEVKLNLTGAALSPTGKNVIEVFAENGDGVIRTRGFVVEWIRARPPDALPPRLFAIVVGVSEYDNQALNLRYSAKDAIDFGHALQLAGRGLFGEDRTSLTILASGTSLEPTKQNLRNAFDEVARLARPGDLLVVYLAGHGQAASAERDQYYFLTKEARSFDIDRDPGLREFSAISSAELKEWLSRPTMPLKQVVVLDTCAAGAAFGEMVKLAERRELSPDQVRAIELLKDATGSWILMGSAADAVSYEANRYAQGLLTYALLQGMKGAALDGDQVEVSRLFGYAQRQVQDLARGIGGLQRPILSAPKGQTFPIGLLSLEDRRQIRLASAKAQFLRARVVDDDLLDPLKLEPALRAELRSASLPQTRGGERGEPLLAYLDSVVDEVPDALIPQVRYTVVGDKLKVRLRLLQNGKPVSERNLELEKTEAAEIGKALIIEIVAASGRLK